MRRLQFTTWLATGLPERLFDTIASHVSRGLGCDYVLTVESEISGPLEPSQDRFATAATDIGFLCPPSLLWLTGRDPPSIELVPMAPVYDDPRSKGRPVYFSDVMVRADSGLTSFDDLAAKRVGYNEQASLSGYSCMMAMLARQGRNESFFGEFRQVGSHRRALSMIVNGDLDAAAIDANVLQAWRQESPDEAGLLRSVETLGPHPVQPIVVRSGLAHELVDAVAAELTRPTLTLALEPFRITGFAPISMDDYEVVRTMLQLVSSHRG